MAQRVVYDEKTGRIKEILSEQEYEEKYGNGCLKKILFYLFVIIVIAYFASTDYNGSTSKKQTEPIQHESQRQSTRELSPQNVYKVENKEKNVIGTEEQGIADPLTPETPQERLPEAEQPDEIPFASNNDTEGKSEPDSQEDAIE